MLNQHLLSSCRVPSQVRTVGKQNQEPACRAYRLRKGLRRLMENEFLYNYCPRAHRAPGGAEAPVLAQTSTTVRESEAQNWNQNARQKESYPPERSRGVAGADRQGEQGG